MDAMLVQRLRARFAGGELGRNVIAGTFATSANLMLLAVSYPLLLKMLGFETYGVWLLMAILLSFAQVGNLGLGQALMQRVAKEENRSNLASLERLLSNALGMTVITGSVFVAACTLCAQPLMVILGVPAQYERVAVSLSPWLAFVAALSISNQAVGGVLSGLGRLDLANYIRVGARFVALVCSVCCLWAGLRLEAMLIGALLGEVLVFVLGFMAIRRERPLRLFVFGLLERAIARDLVAFGGNVFVGALLNMLFIPLNKMAIGHFAAVDRVPVFDIAAQSSSQVRGIVSAGLPALVPETSRLASLNDDSANAAVRAVFVSASKTVAAVGFVLMAITAAVAPVVLPAWLGAQYDKGILSAFWIQSVGWWLNLTVVPSYYVLMGLGRVRVCLLSSLLQTAVNGAVIGMLVASRGMGPTEASLALTVGFLAGSLYLGANAVHAVRSLRRPADCGLET